MSKSIFEVVHKQTEGPSQGIAIASMEWQRVLTILEQGHLQACFECGGFVDTLRRMVLDREGILDMLIKGRGSG